MPLPRFEDLAASADATLDLLALALAAAFRPVDRLEALATLDALGEEVAGVLEGSPRTPQAEALVLSHVLGTLHRFTGDTKQYDRPENSMLDRVLERRRGLPILLSVVYIEAAGGPTCHSPASGCPATTLSRTSVRLSRCCSTRSAAARQCSRRPPALVRPWTPHETTMRMLNTRPGLPAPRRSRRRSTRRRTAARLSGRRRRAGRVRAELATLRAHLN